MPEAVKRLATCVVAAALIVVAGAAGAADPAMMRLPAALQSLEQPLVDALGKALGRKLADRREAAADQAGVLLATREHSHGRHAPAGLAASAPMVLIARPALTYFDGAEFVAAARKGSRLRIAHDGPGSTSEQCAKLLVEQLDASLTLVATPPQKALVDDRADIACVDAPAAVPLAKAGTVTAYAVAAEDRLAALWDVATGPELGLPLFTLTAWYGLYVAAAEDAAKAHAGLEAFLGIEDNVQRLADLGLAPFPSTHRSLEAHQAFVAQSR